MKNTARRILGTALVAAALSGPYLPNARAEEPSRLGLDFSYHICHNTVDLDAQRVSGPHPGDSFLPQRQTTMPVGSGIEALTLRIGPEYTFLRTDMVELFAGAKAELNLGEWSNTKESSGPYKLVPAEGDTRGKDSNSCFYRKTNPSIIDGKLSLGLRLNMNEENQLVFEVSKSILKEENEEYGYSRFAVEQKIGSQTYAEDSITLAVSWRARRSNDLGFSLGFEVEKSTLKGSNNQGGSMNRIGAFVGIHY